MKLVEAHVDGGCSPNPGPGGYAAVLDYKGCVKEFKKAGTGTNNQMEMRAALLALDALKERCEIHIYTDSQYLYKGMTVHFRKWRGNGWKTYSGAPVKNKQLWRQLDAASRKHEVHWHWVRGHAGNPLNERAHDLVQEVMGHSAGSDRYQRAQEADERRRRYRDSLQHGG